ISSKTSSRSTLTTVPSTMSPSLKYLMVSSIAARNASSDPMSLTATLGVELACVLLVMCGLAPDADRESCGHAGNRAGDQGFQDLPEPTRGASYGTPGGPPARSRDVMPRDHDGTHEDTAQRSAYESKPGGSIKTGTNTVSAGTERAGFQPLMRRFRPASAGAHRHVERHPQRGGARHRGAHQVADGVELAWRHLDDELVMDLQQHPRAQPGRGQRAVHGQHRHLD